MKHLRYILILICLCGLAVAQDKPYRILNSFNAGELSQLLNAREDLSKYHSGCSVMENMIPLPQGAAQKRPGTIYVAESKDNTKIRMLSFEYSTEQSYAIEAGNQYFRFYTDNAQIAGVGTETLGDVSGDCVGQWPMNNNAANTTVSDSSATANDGTSQRNTADIYEANGQISGALTFIDPTDYITVSDDAAYDFSGAFTVAGWVYSEEGLVERMDIIHRYDSTSEDGYAVFLDTYLYFNIWVGGTLKQVASNDFWALDRLEERGKNWFFFTATRSAAGAMKLYLDGVLQDSTNTNSGAIDSNSDLYFGIPSERDDLGTTDGDCQGYWKMNDAAADKVVADQKNIGDGASQQNTEDIDTTGVIDGALTFNGTSDYITISDDAQLDFADEFSLAAWVKTDVTDGANHFVLSRYGGAANSGYHIYIGTNNKWTFSTYVTGTAGALISNDVASLDCTFVVGTRSATGAMKLYVNGVLQTDTETNAGAITTDSVMYIGQSYATGNYFDGTIDAVMMFDVALTQVQVDELYDKGKKFNGLLDNIMMFDKALSQAEIDLLYVTSAYEVTMPYLTADLFELKFEQSADVLYITHPDYEPRKLSRLANAKWSLDEFDAQTGPFRDQNTDVADFIAASGTTGTITLTATGCTPFVDGTAAGHEPSGALATSKSQTGALFKLVHPLTTLEYSETLSNNYTASQVEDTSWMDCGTIYKGATWYLTTLGTWTGVLEIQRNYTIGAAHDASGWEKVFAFASTDDRNVTTNSTEDEAAASYRAILIESGDAAEPCAVYFRTNQTEHIGIVEITAVASTTSATATVLTTLASTNATHKWSEGAWSNYRGWPRTVAFFEDRLTFGGNASQPDTIWTSVTSDYENMLEGTDDDAALLFTLSSRQVNVIEWIIGKNKLLIGTSGAEWTLSGSSDEPLTPSNVKAEQHSTYGSADLQATLANESVLFFQRGAEKMRELAYNWETDAYVAPEMTLIVPEITGDGITDVAYQQTPNSILWCVREDGEMSIFVYERAELITSWSRLITDGAFESVAVITGDPEDEVWVSVNRTIGGGTVRYIEYFSARDFGSDVDDAFYVDSGITYDSTATTTITGLTHLNAETVSVLGDGAVQTSQTVSGGQITITSASTVQAGLPFTVQLKTMPLSWIGQGMTIQGRIKKINEVVARYHNSGDFYIGQAEVSEAELVIIKSYDVVTANDILGDLEYLNALDDWGNGIITDRLYTVLSELWASASAISASRVGDNELISITGMDSNDERATFPAGYDRPGYVFIYQSSPEPLTLIALMIEFQIF